MLWGFLCEHFIDNLLKFFYILNRTCLSKKILYEHFFYSAWDSFFSENISYVIT